MSLSTIELAVVVGSLSTSTDPGSLPEDTCSPFIIFGGRPFLKWNVVVLKSNITH